ILVFSDRYSLTTGHFYWPLPGLTVAGAPATISTSSRPLSQVVRQRIANPPAPVRIREGPLPSSPLKTSVFHDEVPRWDADFVETALDSAHRVLSGGCSPGYWLSKPVRAGR